MLEWMRKKYEFLKDYWIITMLSAVLLGIGATLSVLKEGRELLFPNPSTLEVANRQSKQEITRQFLEVTWRRLYRSNQLLARIRRNAPEEEIESAYRAFLSSAEEMTSKTMIFLIAFGELYNDEVRNEYESVIQVSFADVTKGIVDLRYNLKAKKIEGEELSCSISKLFGDLDTVNIQLYQFSLCFDQRLRTPRGCSGIGNVSPTAYPACPAK